MIRNAHLLREFERAQLKAAPPDYFHNLRLFEALYREARDLGVLPGDDPLEGLDKDIRVARAMNVRKPA